MSTSVSFGIADLAKQFLGDDMAIKKVPEEYATIQTAVDAAATGDQIQVAAGYAGLESVTVTANNLTFSAPASVIGVVLTAAAGILRINLADAAGFQINGNTANNIFNGNSGANHLFDGGGDDVLNGGGGSDTLFVTGGVDTVDGGTGTNDFLNVDYSGATESITNSVSGTSGSVSDGGPNTVTYQNVERLNIIGSSSADILQTTSTGDTLSGGGGADTLSSSGGTLYGNDGNDVFNISGGSGIAYGGADTDTVISTDLGNFGFLDMEILDTGFVDGSAFQLSAFTTITDSLGAPNSQILLYLDGASGTVDLSTRIAGAHSVLVSDNGMTGALTLTGSNNNDSIGGSIFADTLNGAAGNDTMNGGAGNDVVNGDAGNDTLNGGGDTDTVDGGAGNDIITSAEGADTLKGGADDDLFELNGATGGTVDGGGGTDTVRLYDLAGIGFSTVEILDAQSNNAFEATALQLAAFTTITSSLAASDSQIALYMKGNGGTVDLSTRIAASHSVNVIDHGLTAGLTLTGSARNDIIAGSTYADTLNGGAGNDTVSGGGGNDSVDGGVGDDTVIYSGGIDALSGGIGNDVIELNDIGAGTVDGGDGTDTVKAYDLGTFSFSTVEVLDAGGTNAFEATATQLAAFTTITSSLAASNSQINLYMKGSGGTVDLSTRIAASHSVNVIDHGLTAGLTLTGSARNDIIAGSTFADSLNGGAGNDTVNGGEGNDSVDGGEGNDTVVYSGGTDALSGGDGNDVFRFDAAGGGTVDGGTGTDTVKAYDLGTFSFSNVEILDGDSNAYEATTAQLASFATITASTAPSNSQINLYLEGAGGTVDLSTRIAASHSVYTVDNGLTAGVTLTGSIRNDNITGSSYADMLSGAAGNDSIVGGGNDVLHGGAGNDTLQGSGNNDTATYFDAGVGLKVNLAATAVQNTVAAGNDTITGIAHLIGSSNDDQLTGDINDNRLAGGIGNDTLVGGDGNDTLDGGAGNDSLTGGGGLDTATYAGASAVTVSLAIAGAQDTGGAGSDTLATVENLIGSSDGDTLTGNGSANRLEGGAGNDTLDGGAGNDTLRGGAGDDVLAGGTGADELNGGAEAFAGYGKVYRLIATNAFFADAQSIAHGTTLNGVAGRLATIFSAAENNYVSNTVAGGSQFWLGAGDAVVEGAWHWLDGMAQTQQFWSGGAGGSPVGGLYSNWFAGEPDNNPGQEDQAIGNWQFDGTWGDIGGAGYQAYVLVEWNQSAVGLEGADTASYAASTTGVTVNLAAGTASGGDAAGDTFFSIENVTGSASNDVLTGDGGANVLSGLAGNDTLDGRAGNDTLAGGDGTDTASYATAGVGVTVNLSLAGEQNTVGAGGDTLSGIENVTGSAHADTLTGDGGVNLLSGGDGNDMLDGGAGADTMVGGIGDDTYMVDALDTVTEGVDAGTADTVKTALTSYTLGNNLENLTFTGVGDFTGTGNGLDNTITGGAGNDTINGGAGNDGLHGGLGTDMLTYAGAAGGVTVNLALAAAQDTLGAGTDTLSGFENLTGSSSGDTLTGNGSANLLNGGAGASADTLAGGGGDDTLDGGAGGDTMAGGLGNDLYYVESAGDVVTEALNEGTDTVRTSRNYQLTDNVEMLVYTGAGNFTGTGNGLANTITAGVGNDTLEGGLGNDVLNADLGTDTVSYAGSAVGIRVNLSLAGSQNTSGAGNDTLNGFENLTGSEFNDQLTGDGAANVLFGSGGKDTLAGLDGDDTLNGGADEDTATYAAATSGVSVSLAIAGAQDTLGAGHDLLVSIEHLTGSAFADTLIGSTGATTLIGGAGNDTLDGGAGGDKLDGGLGDDTFYVGSGDGIVEKVNEGIDTVITTLTAYKLGNTLENLTYSGADKFRGTGNAFDNIIAGGSNADTIEGDAGNDTLAGHGGIDTASYALATAGVTVSLLLAGAQNTVGAGGDTLSGFENLTGSAHADTLTGDGGANILLGGAGNDSLDGGAGADTMEGGLGNDSYRVDDAGDKAIEKTGQGTDTVSTTLSAYTLGAPLENLTFLGLGDFTGTGNALANTLTGGTGNDVLNGGGAADVLNGGGGIDTASYATATAAVKASLATPGTNTGEAAGDSYSSIEGLLGSKFADTLTGDGGDNRLDGGGGLDTLTGGSGGDTFVFSQTLVAGNVATVADFTVGTDTFELSLSVFTAAGSAGTLSANAFRLGATAGDATDRILYDGTTGKLFYDADGTGAIAAKAFAIVTPGLALTENSFQLV